MNERAIVATDLSDASLFMVEHLSLLHSLHIKSIVLLQCPDYSEIASEVFPYIASIEQDILEKQRDILISLGFKVELRISPGNAASEINRIADELDINLVVVGSMGHSLLSGALLGGVAHSIMLRPTKPLLIIRLALDQNNALTLNRLDTSLLTSHILFCTDFSVSAEKAFNSFLVHMSSVEAHKVTLLHVIDDKHLNYHGNDSLNDITTIVTQRLAVMIQKVKSVGVKNVTSHVLRGDVSPNIISFIEKEEVTLTILGTVGTSFIKELITGSVSQYVARHSSVPVLLLPLY
jgi:nucleotide-binding universal stress UspA family protein